MPKGITITRGLFTSMVLQRNERGVCEAKFDGSCEASGAVTATVRQGKKIVAGIEARTVGRAARGTFNAILQGVPTGGPYSIELAIGESRISIADVLVGDVWVVGGQSNMQGCGHITSQSRLKPDPQVHAFYMDDRWSVAQDPIHNLWEAVDSVHADLNGGQLSSRPAAWFGASPAVAFGQAMKQFSEGVPQGLLACAHGGTSMTQWDPTRKSEEGKSLYGATVRRVMKNGGKVAGVIWYQGESDTGPNEHLLYTSRMKKLIASLRRDCGDQRLPIAIVQIARVVGQNNVAAWTGWDSIRDQQYRLPTMIRDLAVVPAIDLGMDDGIHIGGVDQNRLGKRLAIAMQQLKQGRRGGAAPIEVGDVSYQPMRGAGAVVVQFRNVVGRLRAGARPVGFSIVADGIVQGGIMEQVFAVELDGSNAILRTGFPATRIGDASLYYGHGTDPVCNITDEADRSLPAFGPLPLGRPRRLTPFITKLNVSSFLPSTKDWKFLKPPTPAVMKTFSERSFPTNFCSLREEIVRRGAEDNTVYFAKRFNCDEAMKLAIHLGYDGPVKAWMDGKLVMFDPTGTNPAIASETIRKFDASKGSHHLVIALGTASGRAWGIFLQLERRGAGSMPVLD